MLKLLSPLILLVMLTGVYLGRVNREQVPAGVAAYHAKIRDAIASVPYSLGSWVGVDREISAGALQILDANVSLSRTYRNLETGRSATLLVVHGSDVRSLLGHYPPVCYHNQGWTQRTARLVSLAVDGSAVDATEYSFTYESAGDSAQLAVLHFTVLPDRRTSPDMSLLESAAREGSSKYLGAASIQFIVDAALGEAERNVEYEFLLKAAMPWISVVESGIESVPEG